MRGSSLGGSWSASASEDDELPPVEDELEEYIISLGSLPGDGERGSRLTGDSLGFL